MAGRTDNRRLEHVSDLPPDLPRLRTLETWLALSLEQVRARITQVERQERERQRGEAHRPPVPDWTIETGIGAGHAPLYVHVGGCHMAGKRQRPVARDQAMRALVDGVEPCGHCRPDTALGVLE
jgi:hypothetical protein